MGYALVKPVSEQDYLHAENLSRTKHEYIFGVVYAMAGASERHNTIAGNLFAACHSARKNGPCKPFMGDMRLRIGNGQSYYYPDVMLVCDGTDNDPMFKSRPCMVAEVTSPSTEGQDHREKLQAYTAIPSLQEYLIVSQDTMQIDHYLRANATDWMHSTLKSGDVLELRCMQLVTTVDAVYANVEFGD